MAGNLADTYVAALQHDLVDLEGYRLVGVVRRPTAWFHGAVDENRRALGPPEDLLEAHGKRQAALEAEGLDEATAHERAWADVGFGERYREYLDESEDASRAMADLRERLAAGEDLALVCFENTDDKRCHRTMLREVISEGRDRSA